MQAGIEASRGRVTPNSHPRVLIHVATYNERENIGTLIMEIQQVMPEVDLLVVDDNSPDGTGDLLDELAARDRRIQVMHRQGKLGLGTAILGAMRYAIDRQYDFVVNMDADLSHPPRYIPALLAGMKNKDVMIGSRYVPGGGTQNWPASRRFISESVNALVRLLFRMQVRDASGGFRCYRVSKLRQTRMDRFWSRGYSFQQEMLYRCYLARSRLGETPIIFENRKYGSSKVSLRETVRSLSTLVFLGLRALFGVDKR
jgi:dolichol-phosphate mannosyltransferase